MARPEPDDPCAALAELLTASRRVLFFTGAGVSTESGIPDFRSPGGVWTRYDPRVMTFDRYVASVDVRRSSWQMRREFFAAGALPNPAHRAMALLESAGRSVGVVTQNIDGLHTDAGSRVVVELHGSARRVGCIGAAPRNGVPAGCGWTAATEWAFERVDAGDDDPCCPRCAGLVKSTTISFGQVMDSTALDSARDLLEAADALVVVGSSLQVYPAAALPERAVERGLRCALVNHEPTPLDVLMDVVVLGAAGELLPPAVEIALARS